MQKATISTQDPQNRGVKEIFIACVDGLSGFPKAINTVYPKTKVQLYIVHMVRNSIRYASYKDMKSLTSDFKRIYQSKTVPEAEHELEIFAEKWDKKYPSISALWRRYWLNIIPLFDYSDEIRSIIYTTNAIEQASRKWTMPIHDWKPALNRFMPERAI